MKPMVSVIVTAHDRKAFLLDALKSLADQTIGYERYQVIVVKNYDDAVIDDFILRMGYSSLIVGGTLGDKIVRALYLCEGDIITFLEDDDMYARTRIARIMEVFRGHPELSFYHNSLIEVDISGNPTGKNHHPQVKKSLFLEKDGIMQALPELISRNVDFSTGCMAIRKSILIENLDLYQSYIDVTSAFTDSLYFLLSLKSAHPIYIDSLPLTFVRRHDSMSVKVSGGLKEISGFRTGFNDKFIHLFNYIQKSGDLNHIGKFYVDIKLTCALLEQYINMEQERKWLER